MDKRHLDTIFDKYTRLHTDGDGYGVGLYLANKIVNASGGRITVESEPGVGSKFTIFLNK
jgi:two-component system CheB/CheR fusion protein